MPSPTIIDTCRKFSFIKKSLGIKRDNLYKIPSVLILLYPLIVVFLLLYTKPLLVCDKEIELDRLHRDGVDIVSKKISYPKVILYFIILQIPLFIYYISIRIS